MNRTDVKTRLFISIAIIVVALLGWGVYAYQRNDKSVPDISETGSDLTPQTNTADIEARTTDQRVTITVTDDGFEPSEITVKTGTIVTVRNESTGKIQFSSDDHPTHRKNVEMNLDPQDPGTTTSYTAREAGKWGFHDHINDSWTGIIVVEN